MNLPVLDSPAAWYADGLKFTCTQCGNCCSGPAGYVWLSREELVRLAEFFRLDLQETVDRYCRIVGDRISLRERINLRGDHDCIFLRETNGKRTCAIYEVRPLQCRTWPFWAGNLAGKDVWDVAAQRCPGMNKGKHYSAKEIEVLRNAQEWPK